MRASFNEEQLASLYEAGDAITWMRGDRRRRGPHLPDDHEEP
jgi:hypothetical protein